MKEFKYYIIYNCKFIESDYTKYILTYINYELLVEIRNNFNLDEINLLASELI
jgi:hypothetical protein